MTPETLGKTSKEAVAQGIEFTPEEFHHLPPEARVCLAFFSELRERTAEAPDNITRKITEFAGLEDNETTRSIMFELRTANERHLKRLEYDRNDQGLQFTVNQVGINFLKEELEKLR